MIDLGTFWFILGFIGSGLILGGLIGYGLGYRNGVREFILIDDEGDDVLDSQEIG